MVSDPWSPKQLPLDDCQNVLKDGVSGVANYLTKYLTDAILDPGSLGQVADESLHLKLLTEDSQFRGSGSRTIS